MKRSLIKGSCFLLLLAVVFFTSNSIYTRYFYRADIIEADAKMLLELDSLQKICDVLYFGESSNATYSPSDTCSKAISELIAQQVPGVKIGTVQHGAIHGKIYLDLVKNITPGSKVKTVIITMNLRSFDQLWINSMLEPALMKADVMYRQYPPIIKRMMMALGDFEKSESEQRVKEVQWHWAHDKINVPADFKYQNTHDWDLGMCMSGIYLTPDGKWDTPKIDQACSYIKSMGFSIDTLTNPRIRDYDELVQVAKQKKINLVFNLMSENVAYADSLVGKELVGLMKQNRDLLMKRYNKNGVIVVDNLELVNGKDFIEQHEGVNEHYNQVGRLAVATNVVKVAGVYLN